MTAPRALVALHEASRTGAPKVGLRVVHALRSIAHTSVVARWHGPLVEEIRDAADDMQLEPQRRLRAAARRVRVLKRWAVPIELAAARRVIERECPDLIWANSVLSMPYVVVAPAHIPVVLHVHELQEPYTRAAARYGGLAAIRDAIVIACSPAVAAGLDRVGLEVAGTIPSTIDVARVSQLSRSSDSQRLRVVACGRGNMGKGFDLFMDVCELVAARQSQSGPVFEWVGRVDSAMVGRHEASPIRERVRLSGEVDDGAAQMAGAALFILSSRGDSWPLVVLEAMALGIPVVAFDVGGVAAQVGDAGVIIPPLDTSAMADAVVQLLRNSDERQRLSRMGRVGVQLHDNSEFDARVREVALAAIGGR